MDLMDFDQASLYFDEPIATEVLELIAEAGELYGSAEAEALLHKAYFLAPEALLVLVALYRYYFYQHRLDDALIVADRTLAIVGRRLGFAAGWSSLHPDLIGQAVIKSMGLLRFYLHVMKAAGYINLRLGNLEQGRQLIVKLIELDSHDRIGGKVLLEVVDAAAEEEAPAPRIALERGESWMN
jgi:tetratricopeptide (TPR) repeat protein